MSSHWFKLISGKIELATRDSAGFDLFYVGSLPIIIGDEPVALPTGVRTEFSPSLMAIVKEKSGLAISGLEVKAGVIDADYQDEWKVVVRAPMKLTRPPDSYAPDDLAAWFASCIRYYRPITIQPGAKIAQVILVEKPKVTFSGNVHFKDVLRTGGFGSTGA